MNSQYRKNLKAIATACKNYTDAKITELKWELGSHTLDVESDTDVAFSKSVPSGAIGCQINQVGGMSYKSENLNVEDTIFKNTLHNATYSNGVVTTSLLVNYSTFGFNIGYVNNQFEVVEKNEKTLFKAGTYYLSFDSRLTELNNNECNLTPVGGNVVLTNTYFDDTRNVITPTFIARQNINSTTFARTILSFTLSEDSYVSFLFQKGTGTNASVVEMQRFMIAKSNIDYQPYFEGIRDSAVTSVTSKDSNSVTIDTLTIPSAVQQLTGYGWGINDTCYNYVDLVNKKFIQKVDRVDLGSLSWTKKNATSDGETFYYFEGTPITPLATGNYATVLCANYSDITWSKLQNGERNGIYIGSQGAMVVINDTNFDNSTAEAFKSAMNGVYLYYELATPVETDISTYLDGDTIEVESGGTITFTNTYSQDVPSDVDYLIEEVKA